MTHEPNEQLQQDFRDELGNQLSVIHWGKWQQLLMILILLLCVANLALLILLNIHFF